MATPSERKGEEFASAESTTAIYNPSTLIEKSTTSE